MRVRGSCPRFEQVIFCDEETDEEMTVLVRERCEAAHDRIFDDDDEEETLEKGH